MMKRTSILSVLVVSAALIGCGESQDTTKAPTSDEVKTFAGKPLTPEQVARLKGGANPQTAPAPGK